MHVCMYLGRLCIIALNKQAIVGAAYYSAFYGNSNPMSQGRRGSECRHVPRQGSKCRHVPRMQSLLMALLAVERI
jgi:hypothetical protein